MEKIDLKKTYKDLYQAVQHQFVLVMVPHLQYVMADGQGDPNKSPSYAAAIKALYSITYEVRRIVKLEIGKVYAAAPLEGIWYTKGGKTPVLDKASWSWTSMIMQPSWVNREIFERAVEKIREKNVFLPETLRFGVLSEGLSVQTLHVGPYDEEAPILSYLYHHWIPEQQLEINGPHHEIYLNNPKTTAAEKLKTILRQPVRKREE